MYLLQNNNWSANTILRALLTIIFIFWLASVMSQYDDNEHENKQIKDKPAASNIVIEQLTLPPVPQPKLTSQSTTVSKPVNPSLTPEINQTKQSSSATKQQVQQVYQQLSDQGVDIQIAWPQNTAQQQAALDFMYQCAGMQFAVLNNNEITKVNQLRLSDYSDWIRIAQGNLSKKEQHWLNAYALTETAIRLFPRDIDLRLAQHLANTLQGETIASLRAKYQVTHQQLHLTQIRVNNQLVKGSWTLYQGGCD
jgi:hypothetical protein